MRRVRALEKARNKQYCYTKSETIQDMLIKATKQNPFAQINIQIKDEVLSSLTLASIDNNKNCAPGTNMTEFFKNFTQLLSRLYYVR